MRDDRAGIKRTVNAARDAAMRAAARGEDVKPALERIRVATEEMRTKVDAPRR